MGLGVRRGGLVVRGVGLRRWGSKRARRWEARFGDGGWIGRRGEEVTRRGMGYWNERAAGGGVRMWKPGGDRSTAEAMSRFSGSAIPSPSPLVCGYICMCVWPNAQHSTAQHSSPPTRCAARYVTSGLHRASAISYRERSIECAIYPLSSICAD